MDEEFIGLPWKFLIFGSERHKKLLNERRPCKYLRDNVYCEKFQRNVGSAGIMECALRIRCILEGVCVIISWINAEAQDRVCN